PEDLDFHRAGRQQDSHPRPHHAARPRQAQDRGAEPVLHRSRPQPRRRARHRQDGPPCRRFERDVLRRDGDPRSRSHRRGGGGLSIDPARHESGTYSHRRGGGRHRARGAAESRELCPRARGLSAADRPGPGHRASVRAMLEGAPSSQPDGDEGGEPLRPQLGLRGRGQRRQVSGRGGRLPRLRDRRHDPRRHGLFEGIPRRALSAGGHDSADCPDHATYDPKFHRREDSRPAEVLLGGLSANGSRRGQARPAPSPACGGRGGEGELGMTLHRRMALVIALALLLGQSAWHCAWAEGPGGPAKKMARSACDRAAFRVVVDVGHTAESPGAISARGVYEYEFNLRLATLIKQKLLAAGFAKTVLLVTDGPARKSLFVRVGRANRLAADLFLSIHHDSVPDSFLETCVCEGHEHGFSDRVNGHSIFFSNENVDPAASLVFGQLLGEQLKARGLQYTPHYIEKFMGHRQRLLVDAKVGVYRYDQLIVLRTTQMPAVLLEAGSIINRDEELVMTAPERHSLIGAPVSEAVDGFCAIRRPRNPDRVAGPPHAVAKQTLAPDAAPQPASPAASR